VHEPIVLSFFRPACIAHTGAILLHGYWAIYDPPPDPLVYAMHHTILAIAKSCKGQSSDVRIFSSVTCSQIHPFIDWPMLSAMWVSPPSNILSRYFVCLGALLCALSQVILYIYYIYIYKHIYMHIYICVCVCVFMCNNDNGHANIKSSRATSSASARCCAPSRR